MLVDVGQKPECQLGCQRMYMRVVHRWCFNLVRFSKHSVPSADDCPPMYQPCLKTRNHLGSGVDGIFHSSGEPDANASAYCNYSKKFVCKPQPL